MNSHAGCRGDGLLEVLCETSVSVKPCQGALDNPAAWENLKALCFVGPFDDFDGPLTNPAQRLAELVASISAIGEDMP